MRKMNNVLHYSKVFLKKNTSTILTCVGGAGVIATSVLAVRATPKALERIETAKEEKGEPLSKWEIVKVAGPAYIPAAAVGVSTVACIFGANILNKRQQAALKSAYAFLDNSYKEYKKKVGELYGTEAQAHVREEIVRDKYNDVKFHLEDPNKELFYDMFSERYFESTMADVIKAEYEINRKISSLGGAFVNEFYELLDIPQLDYGTSMGWSIGSLMSDKWVQWLDFDHEKVIMDDGLECCIITMASEPLFDYEYY